jgi:hypothetical protein
MNAQTFEVELDHGKVRAVDGGELPSNGRALLTLLENGPTCAELADELDARKKMSTEEAASFIRDLHDMRAKLPPLKSKWD